MAEDPKHAPSRGWREKFADAFRGLKTGIRGQVSFFVHFFFALAVIGAGLILGVNHVDWCILFLCITVVLAAEMFNTALELLAQAVSDQIDPRIGSALDVGSAAVLIAAFGASIVGLIVFLHRVLVQWGILMN